MSIRTPGIPLVITILAILLGLFATVLGVLALIDPANALGYVPGADMLGTNWGGRNAGLGVVLLVAVLLKSPYAYAAAFSGQILREFSDALAALPNAMGIVGVLPFAAVDILGLVFAIRAIRRMKDERRATPTARLAGSAV